MKVAYDLLCIDEIGTPNLSEFQGKTREEIKLYNQRCHFGITGIIISGAEYPELNIKLRGYQERCFGTGNHKPFHYVEILHNSGRFADLGINKALRTKVVSLLNNLVDSTKLKIISSIVDKKQLAIGYGTFENGKLMKLRKVKPNLSRSCPVKDVNLYEMSLKFVLTEFHKYLSNNKKRGLIIAEARGEQEDKNLLDVFYHYQKEGAGTLSGRDLRSYVSDLLIIRKTQNHAGTQLADLICFPLYDKYIPDHTSRTDHFIDLTKFGRKIIAINIFPWRNSQGNYVSKTLIEQKSRPIHKKVVAAKPNGKLRKRIRKQKRS